MILSRAPVGVVVWRLDGAIVSVNEAFCRLLGLGEDEVRARGYWRLSLEGQRQREVNDLIGDRAARGAYEKEFVRADGGLVHASVRGFVLDDGAAGQTFCAFIDRAAEGAGEPGSGERALRRQNAILLALARSGAIDAGDLDAALRELTEAAAEGVGCARVSVWLYDAERSKIVCRDLYELTAGAHARGLELAERDFPSYFAALAEDRQIVADDAHAHPATREFSSSYLAPLGISSMLDVPVRLRGRLAGVLCHEHVGPTRRWTVEEQSFAGSLGDIVSRALEAHGRAEAERALQQAHAELELARRIQTALLPPAPALRGCAVSAFMIPTEEVGGDFYDILTVGELEWIVIGDVSGHGMPAGLVMMMCQTAIRALVGADPFIPIIDLLDSVNRTLRYNAQRLGDDRYATLTILCRDREGTFFHAGLHLDALIWRAARGVVESVGMQGTFLGLVDDIRPHLEVGELRLEKGDVLLLYTDGITEASKGEAMFGHEGLCSLLPQLAGGQVATLRERVLASLEGYEISDDITAIAIEAL